MVIDYALGQKGVREPRAFWVQKNRGHFQAWKHKMTCLENAESELFSILLRHDSRRNAVLRACLLPSLVVFDVVVVVVAHFSTGR